MKKFQKFEMKIEIVKQITHTKLVIQWSMSSITQVWD